MLDERPVKGGFRINCPVCLKENRKTSTGRTPYLVNGSWCIICGYRIEPKNMAEVRSQAAIKAAATRAKNIDTRELFG
jgi:C4-type Zn-finger protein